MEPKLHDGRKRSASASYPPEVTSRRAHTPAVEDNEEAKICTVERRVSLQSSFALAVTIPPPERSRTPFRPKKIAKDLPPLQAVPNGSIMVTVDVEQIDDTGNRLGGTRSAARPTTTNDDRYSACPPARGSTYFDFEVPPSRCATPRAATACSPPPVPASPKKPPTPRGLVHKLSFARLKLKPAKSKESIRPTRS